MQKLKRKKFGEILIAEGVLSHDHLQQALEVQKQTGETLGEILLRENIITESDIIRCICTQYQLPFIRPENYAFDTALLDLFSAEFLYVNKVLPLDIIGSSCILALGEVLNGPVEEQLQKTLQKELFYYFSPVGDIEAILKSHFSVDQDQILVFDETRRNRHRAKGDTGAVEIKKTTSAVDAALDESWESIFDQAEDNVT